MATSRKKNTIAKMKPEQKEDEVIDCQCDSQELRIDSIASIADKGKFEQQDDARATKSAPQASEECIG